MKFYETRLKGTYISKRQIEDETDLKRFLHNQLHQELREHFCLCLVDRHNRVLGWVDTYHLARQFVFQTEMSYIDIARICVILDAEGLILAHNHPSGNTQSSVQDRVTTDKIEKLCQSIGVEFKGHYLVAGTEVVDITQEREGV